MKTSKLSWPIFIAAITTVAALSACASNQPRDTYGLSEPGVSLVKRTCHDVMGLQPGEAHFAGCAETLADSLRGVERVGAPEANNAASDAATMSAFRSYFSMSQSEKYERERSACARLGLDPEYGSYGACVANLNSAFFGLDHPLD